MSVTTAGPEDGPPRQSVDAATLNGALHDLERMQLEREAREEAHRRSVLNAMIYDGQRRIERLVERYDRRVFLASVC